MSTQTGGGTGYDIVQVFNAFITRFDFLLYSINTYNINTCTCNSTSASTCWRYRAGRSARTRWRARNTQISIIEVRYGRESKAPLPLLVLLVVSYRANWLSSPFVFIASDICITLINSQPHIEGLGWGTEMKEDRGALHTNIRRGCCVRIISSTVIQYRQ